MRAKRATTSSTVRLAAACVGAVLAVACAPRAAPPSPPLPITALHAAAVHGGYEKLLRTFVRPLTSETIVAGARDGITRALHRAHVHAALPPDRSGDAVTRIATSIAAARARSHLSETTLTYAALSGMAASARDRYTVFFTPRELRAFTAPLNPQHLVGIGVLLAEDDANHDVRASYIPPGTPADRAGLNVGDVFDAVDGRTVRRIGLQRVRATLLGARGTRVRVRVVRDGHVVQRPFTIVRADVHAPTVFERMLPGGVGYIAIGAFGEPTATEFAAALDRLRAQHATGLVLDVRFNGGGYVGAAAAIVDRFVRSGHIVSVAGRSGTQTYDADGTAVAALPLAVLINHFSASASEITAGALQDTRLASLVGTRSYGKGVVQEVLAFDDGSAMKVTTARYLTPLGRAIDGTGLRPDIAVSENAHPRYGDPAADRQLAAATRLVLQKSIVQTGTPR